MIKENLTGENVSGNSISDRFEYAAPSMGTTLRIVLYSESEASATKLIDAGLTEVERLMPILNNYDPDTEISRVNKKPNQEHILSKDLLAVLNHSYRWYVQSQGAFDITCGALFQLWRQARKTDRFPSELDQQTAADLCGWEHVQLTEKTIRVNQEGLLLDISGIATGYILDQMFHAMQSLDEHPLLIDIGGDIRLGPPPPEKSGWRISVAGLSKDSPPLMELVLKNCALTTSGDRNQYFEHQLVRYSHLIDARKRQPLTYSQSCTVVAANAIDADAGATAMSVLGRTCDDPQFQSLHLNDCIYLEGITSNPLKPSGAIRYKRFTTASW